MNYECSICRGKAPSRIMPRFTLPSLEVQGTRISLRVIFGSLRPLLRMPSSNTTKPGRIRYKFTTPQEAFTATNHYIYIGTWSKRLSRGHNQRIWHSVAFLLSCWQVFQISPLRISLYFSNLFFSLLAIIHHGSDHIASMRSIAFSQTIEEIDIPSVIGRFSDIKSVHYLPCP